jgi:O-antigen/teichoic acid export membrane protein
MPATPVLEQKEVEGKPSKPQAMLRKMKSNTGMAVILKVAAAGINYLSVVLLAGWLTKQDFGIYGTIMSSLMFGSVLCRVGTNYSSIRFLGEYRAQESAELQKGVLVGLSRTVLAVASGVAVAAGLVLLGLIALGKMPTGWVFLIALLLLPPYALMDTTSGMLRTYGGIVGAIAPKEICWRLLTILAGFLAYRFAPAELRLPALVLLSAMFLIGMAGMQRLLMWQKVPANVRQAKPQFEVKRWTQTSAQMWMTQIAKVSFRTLDVLIVGAFINPAAAGLYFAASRTAELAGFLLNSMNLIVGPETAFHHAGGRKEKLDKFLAKAAIVVFVPSLLAFIAFLLAGPLILGIFGTSFRDAYPILIILSFAQLANSGAGSVAMVISMTGNEKVNTKVLLTTAPVTLVAMVIGAQLYGAPGVAVASSLGIITWNVRLWLQARKLGYDPSIFGAITHYLRRRNSKSPGGGLN